jgi:hypothetical protein
MNARVSEFATPAAVTNGGSIARGGLALLAATLIGLTALVAPPLALLLLAGVAAYVLMRADNLRFDFGALAGPAFAAIAVGAILGLASGIGVLFVWRMYQDTRWSVREAARLAEAAGRPVETSFKSLAHAWLTPLYGLTLVAYNAPHMIAGLPLDLPHVPIFVPMIVGAFAVGATFDWALQRAADWRLGELASAPAAHLLAHHVIFLTAFGFGLDLSAGIFGLITWRLAHTALARQASFTAVP